MYDLMRGWPPVGHTLAEAQERITRGSVADPWSNGCIKEDIYIDRGCEYHPACLTCPFSICIKYEGPSLHAIKRTIRQKSIVEDNKSGLSVIQIAEKYNCSRRHVYKLLKEGIAPLVSRVIA